ncbi:Lrp/AsnC family transcriptional regulator [Spongorhabdus nitratireducens]
MMTLDSFDHRILSLLQQDGRISNQQLADKVGLSSAACWRRVKSLEQQGTIQRYAALVNAEHLEKGLCVMLMVSLSKHSPTHQAELENSVKKCPHVLQCYAVSGNADYILRIQVKDMKAYEQFLQEYIFPLEGVAQVNSNFTMREIKHETAIIAE